MNQVSYTQAHKDFFSVFLHSFISFLCTEKCKNIGASLVMLPLISYIVVVCSYLFNTKGSS